MGKWTLWGITSFILLVLIWPVGLAVLIIGGMRLAKETSEKKKQYMDDVHTIAEHMRQENK